MKQHPGDAQLPLDELRDMVELEGEAFSNRMLAILPLALDSNLFTGLQIIPTSPHSVMFADLLFVPVPNLSIVCESLSLLTLAP